MKILASQARPGDVLVGCYDLRGERLSRLRRADQKRILRVDFERNEEHRFVVLWTETYGGPAYNTDTWIEIEDQRERR